MNIFTKIKSFFTKTTKTVQSTLPTGTTVADVALSTATNLGAFNFIQNMLSTSVLKVTGADAQLTANLVKCCIQCVVDTADNASLQTGADKRAFALNDFEKLIAADPQISQHPELVKLAPLIIELLYQTTAIKNAVESSNSSSEIAQKMVQIGQKALSDVNVNPMLELFTLLGM